MKVSVYGLGYVGSVTAACLASNGHQVLGVDVSAPKVETVLRGESPIIESGLEELICENVSAGKLSATTDPEAAAQADVLLVCVGTPSDAHGNLNFSYLERVCSQIGRGLRNSGGYKVIAVRSTLLPGVLAEKLIPLIETESGKKCGEDFGVAVNPEFLREGSAIEDFRHPPFTLIGASDQRVRDILASLYSNISAPIHYTEPDAASLVKYASNAFHGLKVTFANEIGQLCREVGVDGTQVMDIFCQDTRLNISPRYLRPGFAFGGSCLPKDLRAVQYLARHHDLDLPLISSIIPSNRLHIQRVADIILQDGRRNVGIFGLTFKQGTDDLRESPMVELVETLSGKGCLVKIYDRNVELSRLVGKNKAFIETAIPHISAMMCDSLEEVVGCSEVLVLAHNPGDEENELSRLLQPGQLVIDLVRAPVVKNSTVEYRGVAW